MSYRGANNDLFTMKMMKMFQSGENIVKLNGPLADFDIRVLLYLNFVCLFSCWTSVKHCIKWWDTIIFHQNIYLNFFYLWINGMKNNKKKQKFYEMSITFQWPRPLFYLVLSFTNVTVKMNENYTKLMDLSPVSEPYNTNRSL